MLNWTEGSESGTGGITFGATTLTGAAVFDVGASDLLTLGAVGGAFSFSFIPTSIGTILTIRYMDDEKTELVLNDF
mgnify:CR=1 FL=1